MGFPDVFFCPMSGVTGHVFWARFVNYHEPPGGFPGASALVIPRSRFAPVKTTNVTWCTQKKTKGKRDI